MSSRQQATAAGPPGAAARRRSLLRPALYLALSALGGLLLSVSFPPADVGPVAFVALTPLLVAVGRVRSYGRAALCGAVAAVAAYLPAFRWLCSVATPGWLGLTLYVGLYLVAVALVVRLLQRRLPAAWPLAAAALWVGLELFRARLGPGFPWLFLGYTQYRFGGLLQMAAWGGVYAVSFVVFLTGASLAGVVLRPRPGGFLLLLAAGLLVAGSAARGNALAARVPVRDGPLVGIVQQNIPRLVEDIFDPAKTEQDHYAEREAEVQLCAQLTARLRGQGVRLVCWPESTVAVPLDIPAQLFAVRPQRALQEQALGYVRQLGRDMDCYFLIGAPSYVSRQVARNLLYGVRATEQFGNSAAFLSPQGQFIDRYDKIRLVPFGEYIPLRQWLPFLQAFTPIPREITPGAEEVVFHLPLREEQGGVRFGALVCYEDVFSDLCASFRRAGVDFFVNVTDEGWYYVPGELRQHLAMAVFRAVETRTTMVRAANTGISCFIGPRGEVYAGLEPLSEGALAAPIRICERLTPYVRYGDAFAVLCLMLAIALPPLLLVLRR
ncbi:MAG: apolipoprotein N-acyltransferase [Planctomycetota bacterium]|jgi:apolipoprotein N-acyltransferase